jgi:hypothetical protein
VEDERIVVRVNEGGTILEPHTNVIVELITDEQDPVSTKTMVSNGFEFREKEKPVSFYRLSAGGRQNGNKHWQQDLEKNMLSDHLLEPDASYKVELSGDRLLINGKEQSKENHEKYLQLLQKSLDQPLEKDAMYFFNWKTDRRME